MLSRILLNVVRGFAMGSADLVPGVSGGTIALLLGIYIRLIASVRAGSRALGELLRLDVAAFRRWLGLVEWTLILPLGVGILLAVLSLASLLRGLLDQQPELMAAIFLGLVAGSVVVAWRLIRRPTMVLALIGLATAVVAFVLLGFTSGTSEETVAQSAQPQLWAFFVAGAVAICAMILPGVSGSILLVIMGMYLPVLTAVTDRDVVPLVVFLTGAVIGLALFSQLLHHALRRHHDAMLAVLIGLMAGSARVLWPWPNGVESTALGWPEGDMLSILVSLVVALVAAGIAFVLVVVIGRYAQRLEDADPAPGGSTDAGIMEPAEPTVGGPPQAA